MKENKPQLFQFILFFLFISEILVGQNISGVVTDQDGSPLTGANVIVEGTSVGGATNSEGIFDFSFKPEGDFTIFVSYIGYQTVRKTILKNETITDLHFTLIHGNLFGNEVTVLARKREEMIKEVPISMVAIREETITDMGATSIEDLTAAVPNVFAYDKQSETGFNIRGITGGARNPGMATAEGVYLDGVVMGRPNFISTDVIDLQSVEFLRGPQGTLFGRNTVSGAINLISIKPSPINNGSILFEKGDFGYLKMKGSSNFKITDKIYSRFSGYSFDHDGYMRNMIDNTQKKYKNNIGGRFSLRFLPAPKLTIDASVDFLNEDLNQMGEHISDWRISSDAERYNNELLDTLFFALDSINISNNDVYTFSHDTAGKASRELKGLAFNTTYSINDKLNLVSILSYRTATVNWFNDEDGTGIDLMTGRWNHVGEQSSLEFRLISNSDSGVSWLTGIFYYNLYEYLIGPVYPTPLLIHYLTGYSLFLVEHQYADASVKPEGGGNTVSLGTYASVDYDVSKKLTLTLGARYSYDSKHFKFRQKGLDGFGYINLPADSNGNLIEGYFDSTKTWSAVTPSFNVKYALTPNINLFGTMSKGYKSGGFNTDYVTSYESVAIPFKPEYITNYELGLKGGNQANTFFINTALFRMQYDNMQISQFQDVFEGYMISNAASSTIKGLELDFSIRLLNNALTVIGGYGRTEAIFNKFHDGYYNGYWDKGENYTDANGNGQYDDGEDFVDADNNYSGQEISLYPKQSWSFMADFRIPINSKMLFVIQLRSDFIDEKLAQLSTDKDANLLRDDARTLVNGHIGIQSDTWGIFAWGDNLLNNEYILEQGVNGYLGFIEQTWGQPRLMGLRVTYNF